MRSLLISLVLALSLPAWGASATRVSAFEYDPVTGLLTKETIEPDQPQYRLDTAYVYDAYGNRTGVTVSSPATGRAAITTRSSATKWDVNGQFPVTTTNAVGHTESKTFAPTLGTVTSLTGPNGLTTIWQYDGFGRKTRETRADGTLTQLTYDVCDAACPPHGVYRVVTQLFAGSVQAGPVSVAYFDSLNRELRAATQGFNGSWIYTDTVYDNQGRVQKVSRPYFVGQPVYWITSEYDDLGRLVKVFEPDDPDVPALTVGYYGLRITRTNRKGQTITEIKNSQGQKVTVSDALGQTTAYAYDPFGHLNRTTDPAGNQIVNVYDLRGRKTQTTDPDLGTWSYEYNALGELVKQTDAKSQATTMTYDKLGRMIQRVEIELTSNWIYDTSPTRGKGKLYQAKTSSGYIRTHYYDDLGRPLSSLSNLGAGNPLVYTNVVYDSAGRASQQAYSSGFATKQVYNAYGYVAEVRNVSGTVLYWRADQIDAGGHITKETYGNGVVTNRSYAADTGRLQNIVANTAGGQQIQGQAYVYDTIGNVSVYADGPGSQLEIRGGYDAVNRLTQIDSTINGVASSQTLTYDALGNILSKTGVGTYAYSNALHKHAVTAVTGGPVNLAYSYDANGNLSSGAGRSVTWTPWNMPASLTQSGQTQSWLYGPEHDRYKLTTTGRTTWYLNPSVHQGGHYERTQYTSGSIEHRHTLYGGGRAIGEVLTFENPDGTTSPAQTRYFHSDQQGSITAVTDSAGTVITRYRYDPWGKQTLVAGSNTGIDQTRQGHTGHEMLEGGLTHMNGRVYDPVLSRFVSADPYIQSPYDLQSLNRYSYVFNNPLGNTDPSGYWSFKNFLKATFKFSIFPSPRNTFESIRNQPGQQYVDRYIMTHPWAYAVGQAAATYFTAICGGCGGAAWSSYYGYVATGSVNSALRTGAITYVTTYAFNYVDGLNGFSGVEKVLAKGVVGGVSAELHGGNFAEGAKFGFVFTSASEIYRGVAGESVLSKQNSDTDVFGIRLTESQAAAYDATIATPCFSCELGALGRFMNKIPFVKATAWFHDWTTGSSPVGYNSSIIDGLGKGVPRVASNTALANFVETPLGAVYNVGTMVPSYVVTVGAAVGETGTFIYYPTRSNR